MIIIHYFELNPAIYNNLSIYNQAYFLFGRARFIFYLIAGVGLFFLTKESLSKNNPISLQYTKSRLRTRGVAIGLIGVFLFIIIAFLFIFWLEILIIYGIFFFLFSFIFNTRRKYLIILLVLMLLALVPISQIMIIDYNAYPTNMDFYSVQYFEYSILYNLLEAFTTILIGFLLATYLINKRYVNFFILFGFALVAISILLDIFLSNFLNSVNLYILTNPLYPTLEKPILDYISRMGSSFIIIPIIIFISSTYKENKIIKAIALSGQHALTLYVFQILIIILVTQYILINTIFLALIYGFLTILLLILYSNLNRFFKYTKFLEIFVRHYSDSYKNIKLPSFPVFGYSPNFNILEVNKPNNFCAQCGSKLTTFDSNYVFSMSRIKFGSDIHREALKGSVHPYYFWRHINYIEFLFKTYPTIDNLSFTEVYCPKDLFVILKVIVQ